MHDLPQGQRLLLIVRGLVWTPNTQGLTSTAAVDGSREGETSWGGRNDTSGLTLLSRMICTTADLCWTVERHSLVGTSARSLFNWGPLGSCADG